jgi:hypothetical protein
VLAAEGLVWVNLRRLLSLLERPVFHA